jgi:Mitosis protein DIM1
LFLVVNVYLRCASATLAPGLARQGARRWLTDVKPCLWFLQILASVADKIKNFAVIYLVDISECPDFNTMYELYDPCTCMFFFRNKVRPSLLAPQDTHGSCRLIAAHVALCCRQTGRQSCTPLAPARSAHRRKRRPLNWPPCTCLPCT